MKTIVSVLFGLSVLAGIADRACAWDALGLFERLRVQLAIARWRTPMKAAATILIVALGLVARAAAPAQADRWPADHCSSLDRERF
jgi:hypothetical protein